MYVCVSVLKLIFCLLILETLNVGERNMEEVWVVVIRKYWVQ